MGSSPVAIRVEGLGKAYRIGRQQSLGDLLLRRLRGASRAAGRALDEANGDGRHWALRDVSFELGSGEVLGLIGRNGAGKSTLLKVLSRITEPTAGRAEVFGRVGALLEVGTGFHPELTGRENVWLSGAILGMRPREIERQFEDIVDFAGVERFIDTPVKRYSSGMTVRLGFAVAAHLQPEILLVDEVLAVGDAAFRQKCLSKMTEVADGGRSVVFVSHNMAAIEALCDRVLFLEDGGLRAAGPAPEIVRTYMTEVRELAMLASDRLPIRDTTSGMVLEAVAAHLREAEDGSVSLVVEFTLYAEAAQRSFAVELSLSSLEGVLVTRLHPEVTQHVVDLPAAGRYRGCFRIDRIDDQLAGGEYVLGLRVAHRHVRTIIELPDAALLELPSHDIYGTGVYFDAARYGPVPLLSRFELTRS